MDYTSSSSYVTDAGTGNRMHVQNQAIPTAVSDADLNGPTWELLSIIKGAGLTPIPFDKANPSSYTQVNQAIQALVNSAVNPDYKASVRFTTIGNIVLSGLGTQVGGDWGVAMNAGDRVLVQNQTTGAQNGIYVAAAGAWSRSTDADGAGEITAGMEVTVEEGVALGDTFWELATDNPITIGTTALTFNKLGGTTYRQLGDCTVVAQSNTFVITAQPGTVDFRSPTLKNGSPIKRTFSSALTLTVPQGALLGALSGQSSILIPLLIDATSLGGGVELAVIPAAAGAQLDETGVISTEAITTASAVTASIASTGVMTVTAVISGSITVGQQLVGAGVPAGTRVISFGTGTGGTGTYNTTCNTVVASTTITGAAGYAAYSTTARANVPYKLLTYVVHTQASAGVYAADPTLVAPISPATIALIFSAMGQTWQDVKTTPGRALSTTYFNFSSKWIRVKVFYVCSAAGVVGTQVTINGNPVGVMSGWSGPSNGYTVCDIYDIPPWASYSIAGTNVGGLSAWWEQRI